MAERGVKENEEARQFGVSARKTLGALECNRWSLAHVENPRRPHGRQQEEMSGLVSGI